MNERGPRLAAVSVDLDEIDCYLSIHGLQPQILEAQAHQAIYRRAVPRFEELFDELQIPATFFVIGKHLATQEAAEAVRRLHRAGHEIGNHSQRHPYELSRLAPEKQRSEVSECRDAIAGLIGCPPLGFRAPGYIVQDRLLDIVADTGHLYDSSVFPCPAYYAAKAAAIAGIRVRGRRSQSLVDDPRMLLSRADPYRVGTRYWQRGSGLAELPIGVTRGWTGRLPYIGTSLLMAGPRGARWLTRAIAGRPLVNLELHGIDLSDCAPDGLQPLRAHQPDLRVSLARKFATLRSSVETLRDLGYRFVTLAKAREILLPNATHSSAGRSNQNTT